jgi:hypothetical protein
VSAIEVLLRESLGRAPQAEEAPVQRMPASVEQVEPLPWEEMQAIFAASFVSKIADLDRDGCKAMLRERIAVLSDVERTMLCDALAAAMPCFVDCTPPLRERRSGRGPGSGAAPPGCAAAIPRAHARAIARPVAAMATPSSAMRH